MPSPLCLLEERELNALQRWEECREEVGDDAMRRAVERRGYDGTTEK